MLRLRIRPMLLPVWLLLALPALLALAGPAICQIATPLARGLRRPRSALPPTT